VGLPFMLFYYSRISAVDKACSECRFTYTSGEYREWSLEILPTVIEYSASLYAGMFLVSHGVIVPQYGSYKCDVNKEFQYY
jgi:hypothetical protein